MNTKLLWLVASAALLTSACQKDEVVAPTAALKSGDMLVAAASVTGVHWVLTGLVNEGTSLEVPSPHADAPWFMLASNTPDVIGFTGCNDITGRYRLANDQLVFLSIGQTKRFCPDAEIAEMEHRFVMVLGSTDHFKVTDDMLVLLQGERELARFKAR